MSNTLTNLEQRIFAYGLTILREEAILPRFVTRDYDVQAAQKGAEIRISKPSVLSAPEDVVPGPTPPDASDMNPDVAIIHLDHWKEKKFHLNADEERRIDAGTTFMPGAISSAVRSVINQLNSDLFDLYNDVYGYVGTAGTAPFATDATALSDADKTLFNQLCPMDDQRTFIMDGAAKSNALKLPQFTQVQMVGTTEGIEEGRLGKKFGYNADFSQSVPLHTSGTGSGWVLSGGFSAGQGTIASGVPLVVKSGSGTFVVGDVVTLGSGGGSGTADTYTYVVTEVVNSTTFYINGGPSLAPGLALAHVDSDTVTIKASHRVNLAFHRDAFALAIRSTDPSNMPAGTRSEVMIDPISGVPLRFDSIPGFEQRIYRFSILYGVLTIRPELACRVAG